MADDVPVVKVTIEKIDFSANVESVNVEDPDRAIYRARVVFDDPDAKISQIAREQAVLQVSMGWNSENTLLFEGVVKGATPDAAGSARQRVTVTAYDFSYKMKQGVKTPEGQRKPRTFYLDSGTWKDAILKIAGQYKDDGIFVDPKNIVLTPNPVLSKLKPAVKTEGQSDWDFIQKKAVDFNARAFVEVNGGKSQFYFVSEASLLKGDPMGVLHFCVGGGGRELTEFTYERSGSGASPSSTATVIDPQTGNPITKAADPPAPEPPLAVDPQADADLAKAADLLSKAAGKPEESRPAPVLVGGVSDPQKYATEVKADPTRIIGFSGRGTAIGTVKLRAKGKVTINGIAPWAEGDWYVHQVNHIFTRINVIDAKKQKRDRSTYQTKFFVTR
jgi:hypothetical protein